MVQTAGREIRVRGLNQLVPIRDEVLGVRTDAAEEKGLVGAGQRRQHHGRTAFRGLAGYLGDLLGHGPEVLRGQVHFERSDGAGGADVLPLSRHQVVPAPDQTPTQFPEHFQTGLELLIHLITC